MKYFVKEKSDDLRWREHAKCKGMELDQFFPERGIPYSKIREVKKICFSCPVKVECLEMILNAENDNYGIFGGTTPKERRQIRYERTYNNPDFLPAGFLHDDESTQTLALGRKTKKAVA